MTIITGYTTLLEEVATWLAKSNLTDNIPQLVQTWESRFYRQPRNFGRWMEVKLTDTIASSVIPVPDDYLAMKYAYVDGNSASRLDRMSLNQLYGTYPRNGDTGQPVWYARDVDNFVFGPAPDNDYDIVMTYWGKPVALRLFAGDAAAHYLITDAPDIPLFGTLLEAQPFLRNDSRIAVWKEKYNEALQDYRDLFKREDVSGSPVQEVLA